MSDRRPNVARALLTVLAVLVLYPLSVGPVIGLMDRLPAHEGAYEAVMLFYSPLEAVLPMGTPAQKAMRKYVRAWVRPETRRHFDD